MHVFILYARNTVHIFTRHALSPSPPPPCRPMPDVGLVTKSVRCESDIVTTEFIPDADVGPTPR